MDANCRLSALWFSSVLCLLILPACDEEDDETCPTDETQPDAGGEPDTVSPGEKLDGFWGPAPDLQTRLQIFDDLWELFDERYPAFEVTNLDWDNIRETYRPQIEAAQSYGRFYGLLSEIYFGLRDGHVQLSSKKVCSSPLADRPPFVYWSGRQSMIGACVAPLEDERLLVYRVAPDNPAGLKPGDLILGYDDVPWNELLDEVAAMGLPQCGGTGTTELTDRYQRLESVVNNPHLFARLDIWRHGAAEPESVPTGQLLQFTSSMACTDQVPVEGVDFPFTDWADWGTVSDVSYGKVGGKNIGYIYVYSQGFNDVWTDLPAAIEALWETDGIIIDQRHNSGMTPGTGAFELTMNEDVPKILNCAERDPASDDRTALVVSEDQWMYIDADENTYLDKPIAVLTGHKAGSGGDLWPYLISYHPRVRRFGRPTNGAFSGWELFWETDPYLGDLHMAFPPCAMVDTDLNMVHGTDVHPEVSIWLEQGDVAQGIDGVVEAAISWIED